MGAQSIVGVGGGGVMDLGKLDGSPVQQVDENLLADSVCGSSPV